MNDVSRRDFLRSSALAAAAATATGGEALAAEPGRSRRPAPSQGDRVDVNVTLSHWPFRRVPGDDPDALVEILRRNGVTRAWAGSYDGLLHKDLGAVNARLADACRRHGGGMLVPFGSINPVLPGWKEDLRQAHEDLGMKGIRLHPNYHLYTLDDSAFVELLEHASERGLVVQIAVVMEDSRTQHPLVQVPSVDVEPLVPLVARLPGLRVVLLNNRSEIPGPVMRKLADAGQVHFDISRVEGAGPVERLLEEMPASRVLFGSHAPFLYHEAAVLKMKESRLTELQTEAILRINANALMKPGAGGR